MHTFITVEKGRFGRTPDILTTVLYLNFSRTDVNNASSTLLCYFSHAYEGIIL